MQRLFLAANETSTINEHRLWALDTNPKKKTRRGPFNKKKKKNQFPLQHWMSEYVACVPVDSSTRAHLPHVGLYVDMKILYLLVVALTSGLWWRSAVVVSEADAEVFFYFRFFEAPPALLCRRANVALQNMCRHTYSRMKGQEKKHENSQVIQLSVDTDVLFCSAHPHRTQRR